MVKDESATGDVAALILAAGRSSRMGAFKPLLPFGKSTIIETAIANMRAASVSQIVVVRSADSQGEALKRHLSSAQVEFAVNDEPSSEMSSSIACGVRAIGASANGVLINPVDHAAVPAEIIKLVIAEWKRGARLVKPVLGADAGASPDSTPTIQGSGGHPVLVDLSFRDELVNLDTKRGLKALFADHVNDVVRVTVDWNLIARDMDTWDDYRVLHQELFGYEPPVQVPDFPHSK